MTDFLNKIAAIGLFIFLAVPAFSQQADSLRTIQMQAIEVSSLPAGAPVSQDLPFYSAEEMLEKNSAIKLIRRGNFAPEPVINGLSAGQIQVSIDGMRITPACTDRMDPVTAYVETVNMQKMEVNTGAQGSAHGATIGGSINMKLKKADFNPGQKLKGKTGISYQGASRGFNSFYELNANRKKWALRYSGVYRKQQDYRNGRGERVDFSKYEKMNHALHAQYLLKENQSLEANMIWDDAWNMGYPALPMDVGTAQARILKIAYERKTPDRKWKKLSVSLYGNHIFHLMDDSQREVLIKMDMPGRSSTYGLNAETVWQNRNHRLLFTNQTYYQQSRAEMTMYPANGEGIPMFMLTWPDAARTGSAFYVEDRFLIGKSIWQNSLQWEVIHNRMTSETGKKQLSTLNFDYDGQNFNQALNFSSTLMMPLNSWMQMETSLAFAERFASVSEQFGYFLFNSQDGYDYVGNPELKNEKAWQFSAGLQAEKNAFSAGLNFFYYSFRDYILALQQENWDAMTLGAYGVKVYQNQKTARMGGMNAFWNARLSSQLSWQGNMQWVNSRLSNGQPMPMMLPFNSTQSLVWKKGAFSSQLNYRMMAARTQINEAFGERPRSGYHIFDLKLAYQFSYSNYQCKLQAGVDNVFDTAYQQALDWGNVLRPGRNIYAGLTLSF